MSVKKLLTSVALERLLLEETTEDWKGLWELCCAFRGEFAFEGSNAEISVTITPILKALLQRGLIKFSRNQWTKSKYFPVLIEEVDNLLADQTNWSVPQNNEDYSIYSAATDEGYSLLKEIWKSEKKKE